MIKASLDRLKPVPGVSERVRVVENSVSSVSGRVQVAENSVSGVSKEAQALKKAVLGRASTVQKNYKLCLWLENARGYPSLSQKERFLRPSGM